MLKLPPMAKRALSIAFVVLVVTFGAKTCQVETAHCELQFRFQEQPEGLRALSVRLYEADDGPNAEPIGFFDARYESDTPPADWPLSVAAGGYRLEGEIRLAGKAVAIERTIELSDGETTTIYLDRFVHP